jgi:two-component system response regulator BaeR
LSAHHILVIEDEPKIAQLLVDYLERDDYRVSVLYDGSDAIETIRVTKPDFLILDLMLPGKDGLSICREVRKFSNLPIMMLTAKVDEIDRLIGLEIGADD